MGIIDEVAAVGMALMSDERIKDSQDRLSRPEALKPALNSPEGQHIRNATGDQVEAIRATNPDKSDGSATPKNRAQMYAQALIAGQDKSLELYDEAKQEVVAARVMPEVVKPAQLRRELIEKQSETIEELTRGARTNPVYEPILALRQHAERMDPGEQKDMFVQLAKAQAAEQKAQIQQAADPAENKGSTNKIEGDQSSAGSSNAVSADDDRPIYDRGVRQKENGGFETGVVYLQEYKKPEITEREVFERVAALPLHMQVQVLGAGIEAYHGELNHQQYRIAVGHIVGVGDSVVGMTQGVESLGKSICEVAQFGRDIAEKNPRAAETAKEAGRSFSKLLSGGVKVFDVADSYLGTVGAASYGGDHTKAFRDISELGHTMNQRWQSMSPEEKARLSSKLTLDNLGPIAAVGAANKLAKSMDVVGALQEFGTGAKALGAREAEKRAKVIEGIWDCLSPEVATDIGKVRLRDLSERAGTAAKDNVTKMVPWYEEGDPYPISAEKAATRAGVEKSELQSLTKAQLKEKGLSCLPKPYRELYLDAHPEYANYPGGLQVHHRVAKDVLKKYPKYFEAEEIHGLANLRGIPNSTGVHKKLTKEWNAFLRSPIRRSKPDILKFAEQMDNKYGSAFLP